MKMRGKKKGREEEKGGPVEDLKISTDRNCSGSLGSLPVAVGGVTGAIFKERQIPNLNRARPSYRSINLDLCLLGLVHKDNLTNRSDDLLAITTR